MYKKNIHEHPYILDCSVSSKEIAIQEDCLRFQKKEKETKNNKA